MNKEEIEEIETLEIDFKDTDELKLALEVSSKKAIYLIDDLIKHLFELQQQNQKYKEKIKLQNRIDKAIEYIENMYGNEIEFNFKREQLLEILKGEENAKN